MTQVTRTTIPFAGRVANRDRNAPCPCDSGKKYKKCCGDPALTQARWREEQAQREQAIKERAQKELAEAAKRAKEWQEHVTMSGVPFLRNPTLRFSLTNRAAGILSRW